MLSSQAFLIVSSRSTVDLPRKLASKVNKESEIWYTPADSSGNGHRLKTIRISPRPTPGGILGGFRGSEIQKSGIATKRVDQLAYNLVHACGFIWEWT